MDIYSYAEQHPEADYYDMNTGYIYCIQEWSRAKKFFGIDMGIRVVDSMTGETIGYARKDNE